MRARRPWRRCSSCDGVTHWADTAWVCDDCESEWDADHDPKYAAPGDTPNAPPRTENPMLIETPRTVVQDLAERARKNADEAARCADAAATAYGRSDLAMRLGILPLTQAADHAARLAYAAAGRAIEMAALPPGDFVDITTKKAREYADDAHRYARDAAAALAAIAPSALPMPNG